MTQASEKDVPGWPWGVPVPPSGDELPYDDGEPMETELHGKQMDLTLDYARRLLRDKNAYVAGNMAFYYSAMQAKNQDFKAPDVMIFLDVEPRVRKSWVVWEEEGRCPDVVIELVSETTRSNDFGRKKDVYRHLGVKEYFIYDPVSGELWGWHLTGQRYVEIPPDRDGRLACTSLGVRLGTAELDYAEVHATWLRFFQEDGSLVPTEAEAEAQRADAEAQRADAEARRADAAERELAELRRRLADLESR